MHSVYEKRKFLNKVSFSFPGFEWYVKVTKLIFLPLPRAVAKFFVTRGPIARAEGTSLVGGAQQRQPGVLQPGFLKPGVLQPGILQPGVLQPGLLQSGVLQPGLLQPGVLQPRVLQQGLLQLRVLKPGEKNLRRGALLRFFLRGMGVCTQAI